MDTKDNLEVFFRIHFALSDDILEDLLPRFKKLDMRSPLLGKIRRQLDESGPCVMLLNKIFNKPNTTKPSAEVQARADYLEKLFNILVQVRTKLSDELEFKSLMAAIIAQPIIPDYSARLQKVMTKYSTSALLEEAKKLC